MLSDTTPEELLTKAAGSIWSVTVDLATALQLQTSYQVSTMVNQMNVSRCGSSALHARTRPQLKFPQPRRSLPTGDEQEGGRSLTSSFVIQEETILWKNNDGTQKDRELYI